MQIEPTRLIPAILELLKLGVVGLVAGWFTSFMSRRDFISQRWWDRKSEAYSRIVDALWQYAESSKTESERIFENKEFNQTAVDKMQTQWANGYEELRKAAGIGAFIISQRAAEILNNFFERRNKLDGDEDFMNLIEFDCAESKRCLSEIRAEAKRDLSVSG